MMNIANKQHIRNGLLLQLESSSPVTIPLETLREGLRIAGFPLPNAFVLKELAYLQDKGLLDKSTHPLNPGLPRFGLTAAGRDYLESEGLA